MRYEWQVRVSNKKCPMRLKPLGSAIYVCSMLEKTGYYGEECRKEKCPLILKGRKNED